MERIRWLQLRNTRPPIKKRQAPHKRTRHSLPLNEYSSIKKLARYIQNGKLKITMPEREGIIQRALVNAAKRG